MRGLSPVLLLAGAAGVAATFVLALVGETGRAIQAATAASAALVLGLVLRRP